MVEWKKLGEVCEILDSQRKPVAKSNRSQGIYPYYGANGIQDYVDDYIFDGTFLLFGEDGSVINADKSPVLHWATGKIWVNNHAHILKESPQARLRYLYYCLQSTDVSDIVRGVPPKINQANMRDIPIPLPFLSEQERIVGILDTFTSSIENLKAQISLRRKQYEHYRDKLLNLEGKPGVEMKTLGEIARYRRGSFPQPYGNKEWYDGEGAMPFVQVADVEEFGRKLKDKTKQFISTLAMSKSVYVPKGTVIVTLQGSIGKVAITQYDAYVDRTLGIFESYIIDTNKIYFALQLEKIFSIKREKARGGTIKTITKEEFTNFSIPLPSLEEQSRIVSILDEFEASIKNLEAQLEAREKQYEYYRNKLLTFE